ncbi:MAG TPA: serine/threonine-protein kinase [Ktedonobacteraceae bacterium]|nr:serine/threonine-protein kinase [Ktedonobacteraceae bacterium]
MKVIGHGGMAAVYQANDTRQGTLVAIKEMSLSTVPTDEQSQAIQNFLAEARILSRLNHPNLPAFTDFFTEGARHFLVMEYIDGSTLEDLLDRNKGPFSEPRVLGWARQLCDVLEYLHNQQPPVIFRDMKPGNIMLTHSGRIKLIDFGIARLFRHSGSQDTQLLGTPGFAPPEQYGSAQTDERSDIYSLAMTLFQLLTCSISETGFGLTNVHSNFPHISPPVARALEKATSLRPEDRYQSIVVFRRALLGVGAFQFENGGEATTPAELAELCAHYSTEAADYLYSGVIESWLSEIGEHDLARATKRIRATVGDPEMGVNRFLQVVMGPNAQTRNHISTSMAGTSTNGRTGTGTRMNKSGSHIGWPTRVRDSSQVVVRPKTIDFEEVYPGLSHPILFTISGVKGALVKGTIRPVESWIVLDQTAFDGMSTPVRVRADTTRLRGSTHYTGTIIVTPENNAEEISVKVEVDVLGFTTSGGQTTIGQSEYSRGIEGANDPTLQQNATSTQKNVMAAPVTVAGSSTNTASSTAQVNQPYTNAKDSEYKKKYGLPGSDGWQVLQTTPKQASRLQIGITFFAACMAAAFFYLLLSHIIPNAQASLLPPNRWFIAVLIGLVPFATAGAVLVNWGSSWGTRETISRACTGLATALIVLGIGEGLWQNVAGGGAAPPLHFIVMLLITAAGATIGSLPSVSNKMISIGMWMMQHMRLLMIVLAIIIGGGLGFALTSGIAFGIFTPFGVLLGVGIGIALVLRLNRLLKQKLPHP